MAGFSPFITASHSYSSLRVWQSRKPLRSAASPLTITTTSLPVAIVGIAYSTSLSASNGQTPYSWSLVNGSSLPPGLGLSWAGKIIGTPTKAGTYKFTVQVKDIGLPAQTAPRALSITVSSPFSVSGWVMFSYNSGIQGITLKFTSPTSAVSYVETPFTESKVYTTN